METEEKLTAEVVWKMFAETDRRFKETEKQFAMTDRLLSEQFRETDRRLSKQREKNQEEFREIQKELDKRFRETTDNINKMCGHFDRQLGKLVEALIQHSTINLFKEAGIQITHSSPNPERVYANKNIEFDLLLLDDTELVVIEAKISLTKQKVYQFIKKSESFKLFFKEYKSYNVLAGLAYITANSDARELAEEKGFYLLQLRNDEYMEFSNSPHFTPKTY